MSDLVLDELVNDNSSEQRRNAGKAGAIRRALQVIPDGKPTEIADYLKREHNIEVTPAYVSVVKGQVSKKVFNLSFESLRLARKLMAETGGLEPAKRALEAVVEEQERTTSLTVLYGDQMAEIDLRLEDTERPLDPKDKRELLSEKRRLQKLLDALQEF